MSDDEEDYMSDKLLVGCEKNDIRPGLLFSSKQKREHELHKKRLEFKKNKPKSYVQREEEARNEGLSKPLSEENKGYKMMQKMGFKDGTGLGKTQSGIKEPIPINVKRSHSGVGREQHVKSIIKSRYNAKKQKLETKLSEFKESAKQKHLSSMLYKDYFKAQRMCEELDFKHNVPEPRRPYFWSLRARKELYSKSGDDSDDSDDSEESDEEEDVANEDDLTSMLQYMYEHYYYCMYCGSAGVDEEDLKSFCPGMFRSDHDDLI